MSNPDSLSKSAFDAVAKTDSLVPANVRPKDAATVILVRRDGQGRPRILLGQRSSKHAFMPKKYVFPGGAVDPDDGTVRANGELAAQCQRRLQFRTRRRPRAFGLAAIRETFEETGLILGTQTEARPVVSPRLSQSWKDFLGTGKRPDLQNLRFIGRAITPPYRPRRFDARFFMVDADAAKIEFDQICDGAELSDLHWFSLVQTEELDLPMITKFMISELQAVLGSPHRAPLFVYFRNGKSKIEPIE